MARNRFKKRGGGGGGKKRISLLVVAGLLPGANAVFQASREQNGLQRMGVAATKIFTGWDPDNNRWSFDELKKGALPLVAGAIGHKLAGRLGINRMIANVGIPFVNL